MHAVEVLELLPLLNIVVLSREAERTFRPQGTTPVWFVNLGLFEAHPEASDHFRSVFLEHFLPDAEAFWLSGQPGRLRSGICTERGLDGHEYVYELSAIHIRGQAVLLCELGPALERGRSILQRARETMLTMQQLERVQRELRQHQTDLRRAKESAEEASLAKSQFLAQVSHELRTPLHAILGYADLVLRDLAHPHVPEYVGIIRSSGEVLSKLIDDLLDLSRIEAGRLDLDRLPLQPRIIATEAVRIVQGVAAQKSLPVITDLSALDGLWVYGDSGRLRQVLLNLLNNAIKFTSEGSVTLRAQYTDDSAPCLRFEVEDTGIGIAPEQQGRLFQPFSQANRMISRQFGGTGLGLAISKLLVEAMGGKIAFHSTPGLGSCFHFSLPLPRCQAPTAHTPQKPLAAARFPGVRALIAEDEPVSRLLAARLLERLGLEVTTVTNGRSAVEAVGASAFDIVFIDRYMPELDGPEVCRLIRGLSRPTSEVPIVALSASMLPSERALFLTAGASDALAKPATLVDFTDLLSRLLPQRRS
jgi:signal transduction histidine kinase/ActR/RegA family two-component response regulator